MKYRVEVGTTGNDFREITADTWREANEWLIFSRRPPVGGMREHWRVRLSDVVSIGTEDD